MVGTRHLGGSSGGRRRSTTSNPATLKHALERATTKRDGFGSQRPSHGVAGTPSAPFWPRQSRRGLIAENPVQRIEWRNPSSDTTVDVSTVPTAAEVLVIADQVGGLPTAGARYGALFAVVGLAGMRPVPEALGLRPEDLHLPASGWGLARLQGANPSPGGATPAMGSEWNAKR